MVEDPTYRRFGQGWLLAPKRSICGQTRLATLGWGEADLGTHSLLFETHAKYTVGQCRNVSVHALGIIMDVLDFELDDVAICANLATALKQSGWESFYEKLKPLAGTFVLFIHHQGGFSVILDATGTVPACYNVFGAETFVSSHPQLVAMSIGSCESDVARMWREHPAVNRGGAYMPGLLTEFDGVEIITPNQRFDVESRLMIRFYPVANLPSLEPSEIATEVAPMLTGQIQKLSREYNLAISLSGGIDTRVSLAASRLASDKAIYFTYFNHGLILATDREIAERLRDQFRLDHIAFPANGPMSEDTKSMKRLHEGSLRCLSTNLQIARHIDSRLHIRSNTLEVGRGFYLKNSANHPNRFNSEKLSRLFRKDTKEDFQPYFQAFAEKTSFDIQNFYNLHFSDLFYWEHRLAANYGPIYRDGRAYFETYMIYNCRLILELLLSTSLENRRDAAVLFCLMEQLWPEVLQIPIFSGSKFLESRS